MNETEDNPLNRLSDLLSTDMANVDALIIKNMHSEVPLIPKLAQYLISAGGKRIRPLLTLASTALFDGPMDKSYHLAAAVEFIHTATLLHDDVVDESFERRGKETANLVFGNQASVLVGDFLFSQSFQMMVESGSLDILGILSNASAIIAQGEVLQLTTTNDIETNMSTYLSVIESKTAALFAASCEVGAVLSNQNDSITQAMHIYGTKLGTAFQIIDDALDYAADQEKFGKEIGDDFKEGKMTAPVIFAIANANDEERIFWKRTLGYKKQNETDFDTAMEIILSHNALDKTISLAQKYADDAVKSLSALPDSQIKSILCDLTGYTITRSF
ncbi:MAG: farnesyltranstransferase [Zetaproteobacteria bacterium]|nr:MAG: farnesyltranstransferase [Zetaproteobacteria bacterium]